MRNIIAVEEELHALEEAERARAAQWLKEQEEAARAELQGRQAELAAALAQARETARAGAERTAAETIRAAELQARRLAGIKDEVLRQTVRRHLAAIITGRMS